ncbi:E3 ubiquitin-protein ligase BRE1B-like [Oenanthe melanoleuca]|uniref:E3 ubiquitin-protein ligase BRE1B-like n=1 Tax=Oenanthe melanoleuca TaxID=2939378 RepID=UPI0024C198F2|nr:E3 ubiquitin-protein ligase BRE1B-like [Oenanthe melanoleuca]
MVTVKLLRNRPRPLWGVSSREVTIGVPREVTIASTSVPGEVTTSGVPRELTISGVPRVTVSGVPREVTVTNPTVPREVTISSAPREVTLSVPRVTVSGVPREVTVTNPIVPREVTLSVPREVTVTNPTVPREVTHSGVPREVTVTNPTVPREVTVTNPAVPRVTVSGVPREVTITNPSVPREVTLSVLREVTVTNPGVPRGVTVTNPAVPRVTVSGVPREVTLSVPREVTVTNPTVPRGVTVTNPSVPRVTVSGVPREVTLSVPRGVTVTNPAVPRRFGSPPPELQPDVPSRRRPLLCPLLAVTVPRRREQPLARGRGQQGQPGVESRRARKRQRGGSSGGSPAPGGVRVSQTVTKPSVSPLTRNCPDLGGQEKAQENQKEMKLLLDMYKSAPKEQRDKVTLMAAERKSKAELEELRVRWRELEERERRESKKLADEEALRRLRLSEEQIEHLQRRLAATKQEEEALLSEMDVTGQAFEDMQEQNLRLLQQLREKDDANFKLMSERIKANQIHKLLREEKDELAEQVLALKAQVEAQLQVVQKLEEKERGLQSALGAVEKELSLRSQALELHKRKAVEAAQLAEDLRAQGEHVQARLRELQVCAAENRAAKDKESLSLKRAQEELSRLRRKLEKQRKVEVYADADQILQEEIKEYRARLTCPCCNARKKDAVLTKCFHVFCFECVKSRYDTRQRKCPKCNAAFGAHDFHRVYIS